MRASLFMNSFTASAAVADVMLPVAVVCVIAETFASLAIAAHTKVNLANTVDVVEFIDLPLTFLHHLLFIFEPFGFPPNRQTVQVRVTYSGKRRSFTGACVLFSHSLQRKQQLSCRTSHP